MSTVVSPGPSAGTRYLLTFVKPSRGAEDEFQLIIRASTDQARDKKCHRCRQAADDDCLQS